MPTTDSPSPLPTPTEVDESGPSREEIRRELEHITRRMLPQAALAVAVTYLIFGFGHLVALTGLNRQILAGVAFATSGLLFRLWWRFRRRLPAVRYAYPLMAFGVLLILLNCSLHMWLDPRPIHTTSFLLLLFGFGFLVLSTRWLAFLTATLWAAWTAIAFSAPSDGEWVHFGFALFSATVVVVLVHLLVLRHLAKLHTLHRRDVLIQEKLEAALAEAQQAARAKDQFLTAMSHELRTPLSSIIGFSNLLAKRMPESAEDPESSKRLDFLNRIRQNGRRLLSMIDDILELAHLGSGEARVQLKAVDPSAILTRVFHELTDQAEAKGLELILDLPGNCRPLQSDPERLHQIVRHLTDNAVNYTSEGRVTIRLAVEQGIPHSLSIIDTGPGIAEDLLPRIFERFTQAEGGTARAHGGAGLGLPISKELCHLLGYGLEVQSELGQGTTFTVRFAG